jgi:Fe-S cluster assembly iron-binding protein IscA
LLFHKGREGCRVEPLGVLTCSPAAAQLIAALLQERGLGAGGLRLSQRPASPSLEMSLAATPDPDDLVVSVSGTSVFLDAYAVGRTRGSVLEASEGAFVLHEAAELARRDRSTAARIRAYLQQR